MKKNNKKGFTLIELLAVIIILGILLLIAVPVVSKYITDSRKKTYKNNLLKMVDEVSNNVNSLSGDYTFNNKEYLIVPFSCIDLEKGSNTKSPFGTYDSNNSFVVVTWNNETGGTGFKYYVTTLDDGGYGVNIMDPYSSEFKVVSNPKETIIEESSPNNYQITGEISTEFAKAIVGKIGKLKTCEKYDASEIQNNNFLYNKILSDNEERSDTNIDFSKTSEETGTNGLYYTSIKTEGNKTTYYYRGDINNNYVRTYTGVKACMYNGHEVLLVVPGFDEITGGPSLEYGEEITTEEQCQLTNVCQGGSLGDVDYEYKVGLDDGSCSYLGGTSLGKATYEEMYIDWRIVRINEDGSIRIITKDVVGKSAFNEYNSDNDSDNAHVGYMYGETKQSGTNAYNLTHDNDNPSTIKTYLDDWYTKKISNLTGYLADAGFCNDRSIATSAGLWHVRDTALGYGRNNTYYGGYYRLSVNKTPQFACPQTNDLFTLSTSEKGNKELQYPIGLLTADEVLYAGGIMDINGSSSTYLNGSHYWTMTPFGYYGNTSEFRVYSKGFMAGDSVDHNYISVRPVINLRADVELSTELPSGCTKLDGTEACPYIIKTN